MKGFEEYIKANPIIFAPMSGYSESIQRRICRAFGAGILFTWLVNENTIINPMIRKPVTLNFHESEHPIAIQLFGNDPEKLAKAAELCENMGFDAIDLNVCCPANNVIRKGAGGALLKDLVRLEKIIKAIRSKTNLPVSLKFRSGFNPNDRTFIEIARLADEYKIDMLIFHPEPVTNRNNHKANWKLIKELKENTKAFVVGNGEIKTAADCIRMKNETNCDGIMIGRAAIGRPWIFTEALCEFKIMPKQSITQMISTAYCKLTGEKCFPNYESDVHALVSFALFHMALLEEEYKANARYFAIKEIPFYISGFPGAKEIRIQLFKTEGNTEKMKSILLLTLEKLERVNWALS